MRDPEATHDGVPLPPVSVHGATEEARLQGQVKVESFKKQQGEWVLKTRVLPAGKPLRLRVANVDVSNRVRRQSVLRKDQILALKEDHLGRVQHTHEAHEGERSPVTPTPAQTESHSSLKHRKGDDWPTFARLGKLPFAIHLPG